MDVKVYLASGSDASCRAVLEAMACGLPVIVYPVGAVFETLGDGLTGYPVANNDPEALARRLAELLGDRNVARKMGEAARQRVEEDYRLQRTKEFYHSLVESK